MALRKILLVSWASWCGCRNDLVLWQSLFKSLDDPHFVIISIALDQAEAEASRLHPDSWAMWRQVAQKNAQGLAVSAAFWNRVMRWASETIIRQQI